MRKFNFPPLILVLCAGLAHAGALTDTETRWLTAGLPVLNYAKQELKLPVDIIVQPEARPHDVPLALGFEQGRCKLVLSMRGNPDAETILDGLPPARRALMIEVMTAHEIGHCWRYVQGSWHALPSGFVDLGRAHVDNPDVLAQARALRETRREEGYADLVALAWIQQRHPAQYGQALQWLRQVRATRPEEAGIASHDTEAWLRLAPSGAAFSPALPVFEQAGLLWRQGLLGE